MISASNDFITTVQETSRQFKARLLIDGSELDCDISNIKCYKGSCGSELAVGAVYAPYLEGVLKRCDTDLLLKKMTYQIGLMVNGSYEYITMGTFTVLDPRESNGSVNFTAVGTLGMKGNDTYTTSLTYPTTINAVISELSTALGTTITLKGLSGTGIIEKPLTGLVRGALSVIGGLLGGFVTEDNTGNIVIAKYNSGETLSILPYRSLSLPEFRETPYLVAGVHITVTPAHEDEEGTLIPEVYFEYGTPMIIQTNE